MKIMHLHVGDLATNCYIIFDENTKEGAVIDPGGDAENILKVIHDNGVKLNYILLTHGHFDHILAVNDILKATQAKLVINKDDRHYLSKETLGAYGIFRNVNEVSYEEPAVEILAEDGTELKFGSLTAKYIHTPGHTPGSSTIMIGDILFTGDTLFRHECGRCDLPGGDFSKMLQSLKKLHDLQGDYQVLPGHDRFSTLSDERDNNPYMKQALEK